MKPSDLATTGAAKPPSHGFYIKIQDVGFWFWFFQGIQGCLTFLFFRSNAALGTALVCITIAVFAIVLLSKLIINRRLRQVGILQPAAAKLLIAFVLWMGMTLLWTQAQPWFSAFGYWAALVLSIFVVLLLLCLDDVEQVALKSLQGLTYGGLTFALVALLSNVTDGANRLGDEEFLHPGNVGNQMAISSICCIYLALHSRSHLATRWRWMVILAVLIFCLLRSLSKNSIIGFLLAVLVYILRSKISNQNKTNIVLFMAGLMGICFTTLSTYLDFYLNQQQGGNALTTVSGRTSIWEMTWNYIQANPIWGYGFMSYRVAVDQIIALRLVHPHNEWLQVWFCFGLVGLILAVLIYATYYWQVRLAGKARLPQEALGLAWLVYFLIRGSTDASLTDIVYPPPLMLLMVAWLNHKKNSIPSSKQTNYT